MPRLSDLGERKILEAIRPILDRGDLELGLEDDCAAVPMGSDYLLITTDVVNARTHIPRGATGRQVGWYTAAVSLSDIAAKGGRPLGLVAAMTLPRSLQLSYLREIARGMDECCRASDVQVLGGDTKEGPEISLAATAVGLVPRDHILRRRGARAGDLLAVTGELGRGGWGYLNLKRGKGALEALLRPAPRVAAGRILAGSGVVTSCMDLSDGLATSLDQLSHLNGLTFEVDWRSIPMYPRLAREGEATQLRAALYMGGDYELLFTVPTEAWEEVRDRLSLAGERATAIGAACEGGENLLVAEEVRPLGSHGYEHFRSETGRKPPAPKSQK